MLIFVLVFWSEFYESFYDAKIRDCLLITNGFAYQKPQSIRQRMESFRAVLEISAKLDQFSTQLSPNLPSSCSYQALSSEKL